MDRQERDQDPEPSERFPAGPLYVPVRPGRDACTARLFRTPLGARTAVGFTSARRLTDTLGPDQEWIRLGGPALRALAEPLGAVGVTVDPRLALPIPPPPTGRHPAPSPVAVPAAHGAGALAAAIRTWLG